MLTSQAQEEKSKAECQCGSWDRDDPVQNEVSRGLKNMEKDIMGIIYLGKDGIMRSLTAYRRILAAMSMSPEQIAAFEKRLSPEYVEMTGGFAKLDGFKTPKEKWLRPDKGILPAPLAQEKVDEVKNMSEKGKKRLREHMRKHPELVD